MCNNTKILLNIFLTIILLMGADWCIGSWSESMYYRSKYGMFHRQIYSLQKSNEDVFVIGSSRAAHHYVPSIFEDSLGMDCYNAGSDGMCIYYHYALLSARVRRHSIPKIVVYEVLASDAEVSRGSTFSLDAALDRLAPHYGYIPEIDSLFEIKGWKDRIKLFSKTYRYNSKLVQTIKCNYIPWPEDKGYEALKGTLKKSERVEKKKSDIQPEIEPLKLTYLRKLICLCKVNKIKIFLCHSPQYNNTDEVGIRIIKDIAKENAIPFWEYGNDQNFHLPEYFKDRSHLNDKGAHEYSKRIVSDIKRNL